METPSEEEYITKRGDGLRVWHQLDGFTRGVTHGGGGMARGRRIARGREESCMGGLWRREIRNSGTPLFSVFCLSLGTLMLTLSGQIGSLRPTFKSS
jgi:hypothetical protein